MALTKKQSHNNNKKNQNHENFAGNKKGKHAAGNKKGKHAAGNKKGKHAAGKKPAPGKENKSLVKRDSGKKEPVVKKENRIEQVKKFVRSAYNEMKKVHWPTRREVVVYTAVVLVAVLIVGIMIWVFDLGLSSIFRLILQR